ncbi:MAG: antibiotic biosynthesis monooxygenase [Alphaproteobacteria bacterium]|nr:antibiotic biosynthesis monooxygenase [Alphaproteobacteria bacterium]
MSRPPDACVLVISLHVLPGHVDAFLALLTPVLDAMRHETTFVNAVLHQDPDDATRFMLYETWADRDDLQWVQIHRGYRRAYEDRLPDLLREPRRVEIWQCRRADFVFLARGSAGT